MKQATRIALITGGNKGMGLEIGRELGQAGITVLLGARSMERGNKAAGTLRAEGIDAHAMRSTSPTRPAWRAPHKRSSIGSNRSTSW